MLTRTKLRRLEGLATQLETSDLYRSFVYITVINSAGNLVQHKVPTDEYGLVHPGYKAEYANGEGGLGVVVSECWRLDCPWHGPHNSFMEKIGALKDLQDFCSMSQSEQLLEACSWT